VRSAAGIPAALYVAPLVDAVFAIVSAAGVGQAGSFCDLYFIGASEFYSIVSRCAPPSTPLSTP
jgi:hypothetical protein